LFKLAQAVLIVSVVACIPDGHAAEPITVSEYVQMKGTMASDKTYTLIKYLSGVADALYGSNFVLVGQGKAPLYCFDSPRPLTATELIKYIDALLYNRMQKKEPVQADFFIAVIAANAVGVALKCS
jgi:hypothetical protein